LHVPTNAAASSVNGPMVNVQSIKMLADTCGREDRSPIGDLAIADLFRLLPVLQRLRPRRNAVEVGVGAARARRVARFLSGGFLPAGLLLVASFLALALALALLL
jgi:hypothetical protein